MKFVKNKKNKHSEAVMFQLLLLVGLVRVAQRLSAGLWGVPPTRIQWRMLSQWYHVSADRSFAVHCALNCLPIVYSVATWRVPILGHRAHGVHVLLHVRRNGPPPVLIRMGYYSRALPVRFHRGATWLGACACMHCCTLHGNLFAQRIRAWAPRTRSVRRTRETQSQTTSCMRNGDYSASYVNGTDPPPYWGLGACHKSSDPPSTGGDQLPKLERQNNSYRVGDCSVYCMARKFKESSQASACWIDDPQSLRLGAGACH
jgi:hypothetical protein